MALRPITLSIALLMGVIAPIGVFAEVQEPIHSEIIKTEAKEIILVQTVIVEAAVGQVWQAYTTSAGWMAWASPLAEIDLRAGGSIKTHYGPEAKIGDAGTNTLHIVNYIPERALTLRAELSDRWPEVMKEDDGKLMNLILFQPLGENRTRIESYGVGYRDLPAYDDLLKFFIPANEGLFRNLKAYLETEGSAQAPKIVEGS